MLGRKRKERKFEQDLMGLGNSKMIIALARALEVSPERIHKLMSDMEGNIRYVVELNLEAVKELEGKDKK